MEVHQKEPCKNGRIEIGEANKQKYAESKVKQEKYEMAKKCLQKGMSLMDIVELTGLEEAEIIELNK